MLYTRLPVPEGNSFVFTRILRLEYDGLTDWLSDCLIACLIDFLIVWLAMVVNKPNSFWLGKTFCWVYFVIQGAKLILNWRKPQRNSFLTWHDTMKLRLKKIETDYERHEKNQPKFFSSCTIRDIAPLSHLCRSDGRPLSCNCHPTFQCTQPRRL